MLYRSHMFYLEPFSRSLPDGYSVNVSPIDIALNASAGFLAGTAATVLWEWLLKPRRVRRNVARLLHAEVADNRLVLSRTISQFPQKSIAQNFHLSTIVLTSVAEHIGELPEDIVRRIIKAYAGFDRLAQIGQNYQQLLTSARGIPRGAEEHHFISQELDRCVAGYSLAAEYVEKQTASLEARLSQYAASLFSRRRWGRPTVRLINMEALVEDEKEFQASLEAYTKEITVRGK